MLKVIVEVIIKIKVKKRACKVSVLHDVLRQKATRTKMKGEGRRRTGRGIEMEGMQQGI
jgi:hypothetical protein